MGRSEDMNEILHHEDQLLEIEKRPRVAGLPRPEKKLYTAHLQGTFAIHQSRYPILLIQRYPSVSAPSKL